MSAISDETVEKATRAGYPFHVNASSDIQEMQRKLTRAALEAVYGDLLDHVNRWYITDEFFANGGKVVMGPFVSRELAMAVRSLREEVEGHHRCFVDEIGGPS